MSCERSQIIDRLGEELLKVNQDLLGQQSKYYSSEELKQKEDLDACIVAVRKVIELFVGFLHIA